MACCCAEDDQVYRAMLPVQGECDQRKAMANCIVCAIGAPDTVACHTRGAAPATEAGVLERAYMQTV